MCIRDSRTCGIYVEYRAAGVCRQLAGRNFTAGAGIDQLLLSALRVLAGQRIQLEAGIVRDQLLDLGEGILLVFLDCNDCGLYAHDVGEHLQAANGLFRTLEQQTMVGRDVRLTLCSVDAVSYTHLDVYKRQLKERPFCFAVLLSGFSISRLGLVRRGLAVGRGLVLALRVLSLRIAVIIRCIAVQNSLHVSRQIVLGVIIGDDGNAQTKDCLLYTSRCV